MTNQLLHISQPFAHTPDLIQGSGGNTSVKLSDTEMLIKASGFRLCDMTEKEGFVPVDYKAIQNYFSQQLFLKAGNADSDLKAYTINQILSADKHRLPSMETGFHSVLLKYVVHTHSVYANLINCTADPEALLKQVFPENTPAFISFYNPGFYLSNSIYELVKRSKKCPKIIFLQNHGLITTSDDAEEAIALNDLVNKTIQSYFNIDNIYPDISLETSGAQYFISRTSQLQSWMSVFDLSALFFEQTLFPDQTVFFHNQIALTETADSSRKINIHPKTLAVTYHTNEKEATAIDETLTAYFYILYHLKVLKLAPSFIAKDHVDYINNMDMEKYRKSLME